jgi:hypothetical protein
MGKTYCPLMEGVLIMVIVVDGVAVPTKGQFDVTTLVDEKKCPYVIETWLDNQYRCQFSILAS